MTEILGYVIPGVMFQLLGLKWIFDIHKLNNNEVLKTESPESSFNRINLEQRTPVRQEYEEVNLNSKYLNDKNKSKIKVCHNIFSVYPIEGFLKLLFPLSGSIGNVLYKIAIGETISTGSFLYPTMFIFFSVCGILDILEFWLANDLLLPFGINKFSMAMAFGIEGLLIHFQIYQQAFMQKRVHNILVNIIFSCAFINSVEIVCQWQLVRFIKAFLTILHGGWYIHSGFILHNPAQSAWTNRSDYNRTLTEISIWFTWHCLGVFLIVLVISITDGNRKLRMSNLQGSSKGSEIIIPEMPSSTSDLSTSVYHTEDSKSSNKPPVKRKHFNDIDTCENKVAFYN